MNKKFFERLLVGLMLFYCLVLIGHILTDIDGYQWDFQTLYSAAKAFAAGASPYDDNILYAYPPAILWFFLPFTLAEYHIAFYLFFFLKCILLAALIYLWSNKFLKEERDIFFYLFCLFAFNTAIYLDMAGGNVSVLEQFLIWLAFYFYLKRKPILFCAFILMAASFKIIPILFLCLLLFSENKKKHLFFFGSAFLFFAYLIIQYIISPHLFTGFIHYALYIADEGGTRNPCTFALIKALIKFPIVPFIEKTGLALSYKAKLILFFTVITPILTAIIMVSRRAFNALKSVKIKDKERILLFFACLTYVLILPRFKDYSYILLIVPTYFIIRRADYLTLKGYPLLFIIAVLPHLPSVSMPLFDTIFSVFDEYYALMLAYVVWGLYLYEIFALKRQMQTKS